LSESKSAQALDGTLDGLCVCVGECEVLVNLTTMQVANTRVPAVSAQLLVNGAFRDMIKVSGQWLFARPLLGTAWTSRRLHLQQTETCYHAYLLSAADNYFQLPSGGPFAFPSDIRVTSILGDTVRGECTCQQTCCHKILYGTTGLQMYAAM
jgi:hypothetical protein